MDGNNIMWTFNLRALKHFVKLRSSGSAYYGIKEITETIPEHTPHKYKKAYEKSINEVEVEDGQ